jgi:hypothetical protein
MRGWPTSSPIGPRFDDAFAHLALLAPQSGRGLTTLLPTSPATDHPVSSTLSWTIHSWHARCYLLAAWRVRPRASPRRCTSARTCISAPPAGTRPVRRPGHASPGRDNRARGSVASWAPSPAGGGSSRTMDVILWMLLVACATTTYFYSSTCTAPWLPGPLYYWVYTLYSLRFHIRSRLGQWHGHQSTTLTSLFYKNLYWKVIYVYSYKSNFQDKSF